MPETAPLPRDEDGHIQTSAAYGHGWLVKIEYTTDFDGRVLDEGEPYAETLHGPFTSEQEATEWMEAYPDFEELAEITVINLNLVRPA